MVTFRSLYNLVEGCPDHMLTSCVSGLIDKACRRPSRIPFFKKRDKIRKIFEVIENRDEEIRKYLERKEQDRSTHLLTDMGNLMDEMFDLRLELIDGKEEILNKDKS